jgi:GNAT superfamily N-acetyltransferase
LEREANQIQDRALGAETVVYPVLGSSSTHHARANGWQLCHEPVYHRYFAATTPSRREIERLCTLDQTDGTVYLATAADDHGRVIGLGCYAQQPACWGELALLIEDAYQGRGLGRKLFRLLTRHAAAKGLQTMDVNILPSNRAMLALARNSGRPHHERYLDGMQQVRLALQ